MIRPSPIPRFTGSLWAFPLGVLLLMVAPGVEAQPHHESAGGEEPPALLWTDMGWEASDGVRSDPDFLFRTPTVSLGFRGGLLRARGDSDIYDFFTEELTLEQSDFHGVAFLGEMGVSVTERVDAVVSVEHTRMSRRSEFREWIGDDGLPIEQVTALHTTPITAGARLYLLPRGESVGQFVWVPASFAPFVGGGGGAINYRLEQEGEFVDFQDRAIFTEHYESSEWGATLHLSAGGDLRIGRRSYITGEARYRWAASDLGRDFVGFEPIDLSGLTATVGLTVRF